ncbi:MULTISPECIES: hypothetical protein [unclassified Flavobacterium]|uniref:hypothetical protein n=1 Tax=unclassified Flavobacterium TaxID=196869 RepID=UPI000F0C2352|nr:MULTISPECIES: hypothetical protein [unclassified Flavobacterium]AYN05126.1 hypothetical protein EAG11_13955 [Flavobacterium sp. 140616W15]MCD0473753.1 hypothetical protein [Flavobacterium sp. EDS]
MSTTNLNSEVLIKYPPGVCIESIDARPIGSVSFPENRSKALLPPIVQASFENNKEKLVVQAVVFIAEDEQTDLCLSIYQNCYVNIEGIPQLQFFVCYDMVETVAKEFNVYEVTFYADPIPFDDFSQIKTIVTFLWDVDPIGSRGTVTTVQAG